MTNKPSTMPKKREERTLDETVTTVLPTVIIPAVTYSPDPSPSTPSTPDSGFSGGDSGGGGASGDY